MRMIPFAMNFLISLRYSIHSEIEKNLNFFPRKDNSRNLSESYLVSTFNPHIASPFSEISYTLHLRTIAKFVDEKKTRQCTVKMMSRNREAARSSFASPCSFNAGDMPDRLHYRCLSHNVSLTYTECIFLSTALESHSRCYRRSRAIVIIDRLRSAYFFQFADIDANRILLVTRNPLSGS